MYSADSDFVEYITSSRVRTARSKIVVDGTEYTDKTHIKSYPKVSHSSSKMIGGFPAKNCEFEIYNLDGNMDLNGKEISVYRGLEIDGIVTWIPMGFFVAEDENITNNKTARSISFKGTDRAVLFDCTYSGTLEYPTTLSLFVQEICTRHGVKLETVDFPMSDFTLAEAPNMDTTMTDRELISRAAELGGCIAQISRTGGLRISKPVETGIRIDKATRYKSISREPRFLINSLVFGHDGYDDDITYPETEPENLCQWRIDDNPFVDKSRESSIKTVAEQIFGMAVVPFQITDCIDDYILDVNDVISVQDKDGTYFSATILKIENTARIRSTVAAETQTVQKTNYKLAGSIAQTLKKVQLQVDHQNLSIQTLVQSLNGVNGDISALKQTANSIQSQVTKIEGDYVTQSTFEQLSDSINIRFEQVETPSGLSNSTTTINAQGIQVVNGDLTAESESFKTDLSPGYIKLYYALNQAIGTNYNYLTILDTVLYSTQVTAGFYSTFVNKPAENASTTATGFRFGESDGNARSCTSSLLGLPYNWETDYMLIEPDAARVRKTVKTNEAGYNVAAGLRHYRSVNDVLCNSAFGLGIDSTMGSAQPSAFMEINNAAVELLARIDVYQNSKGGCRLTLRGSSRSDTLSCGDDGKLYYNGKALAFA